MKNFLRIAIVIILLIGLGFGAYVIFFKPANDEAVFLALAEINSEEEKQALDEMYRGLSFVVDKDKGTVSQGGNTSIIEVDVKNATNYKTVQDKYNPKLGMVNDEKNGYSFVGAPVVINEKTKETIVHLTDEGKVKRDANGEVEYDEDGVETYTYPYIKSTLDGIFNSYISYTQAVSKDVDKGELNDIKELVEAYKSSFEDLNTKFKSIESMITQITNTVGGEDWSVELEKRYQKAVVSYRAFVNSYANLTERVISFVREYVFEGAVVIDDGSVDFELVTKYIKTITEGAYSYSTNDDAGLLAKHTADTRNNKLIDMIESIAAFRNGNGSSDLKYIPENSIIYNEKVYENKIIYLVDELVIKVGLDENSAYIATFKDSDAKVPVVILGDGTNKTVEVSEDGSQLTMFGETNDVDNGVVVFDNVIFEQDGNTLKMYLQSASLIYKNAIDVTGVAKITSNEIYFGTTNRYAVSYKAVELYEIGETLYGYNSVDGKIYKLDEYLEITSEQLSEYEYYNYSSVGNYGVDITYKLFVDAFRKIYSVDSKYIDTLINLRISDLTKLSGGNVEVLSTFPETIQAELRIIVAMLGF